MTLRVDIEHRLPGFELSVAFEGAAEGVTALFGPSGAGKSSTVNAIAGLLRPDAGRIALNGDLLFDSAAGTDLPPRHRKIGYVFQQPRLFPHLSVRGNLLFGWKRAGKPCGPEEIEELLKLLAIGHLLERRTQGLSGGERQRIALARALLTKPRLLLLDEPMTALDEPRRMEIMPYLERLRAELRLPIIYVSHSISEVARLADRMVILDAGRVAAQGSVEEIMARLDLFPLTGRFEAGAVLRGRLKAQHETDGLSEVDLGAGSLFVPLVEAQVGDELRLRIRSRDVILATEEPHAISTNNLLPCIVTDLRPDPGAYADIQMAFGEHKILARLTRRSVERLGLAPGKAVFALVKSAAVDRQMVSARGD